MPHVVKVIDEEKIQENALKNGTRLKNGLIEISKKYSDLIKDVRGKGSDLVDFLRLLGNG